MPGGADKGEREVRRRGPVVVVSGPPGGGKSVYAKRLARDLGLRYFTTGSLFRQLARELGVSLVELSRMAERDPRIDLEIDRRAVEEALRGGVVVDSHLAGWTLAWVADVLIYVKASTPVRVERVAARDGVSVAEAMDEVLARELSQWRRFRSLYGVDTTDLSAYHLVIDTSILGIEEVYGFIKRFVVEALRARGYEVNERGE
ncbi:(d)CMP kinase [Stetteria hydrogenophila]